MRKPDDNTVSDGCAYTLARLAHQLRHIRARERTARVVERGRAVETGVVAATRFVSAEQIECSMTVQYVLVINPEHDINSIYL